MKIAFWSNTNGRAGTTSNMACIAVMCSMIQKKKTILFENHGTIHNLEHILTNTRGSVHNFLREQFAYYDQTGLESLIKRVHSNHTYEDIMEDISMKFLQNLVYYLPRNLDLNQEYFEYELNQVIHPLLGFLEDAADYVFVDTASSQNLSTKTILDEADLVVVNLCQSKQVMDNFFHEYHGIMDKSVYLIGNYQPQSLCNLKNIQKCYKIEKEMTGVIPYNIEFHDALSSGSMIEFLTRNLACKQEDENYYFIQEVIKASKMIWETAGRLREESKIAT